MRPETGPHSGGVTERPTCWRRANRFSIRERAPADDVRARGHRVNRMLTGDLPYWLPHIGYRDPEQADCVNTAGRPSVRHDVVTLRPE